MKGHMGGRHPPVIKEPANGMSVSLCYGTFTGSLVLPHNIFFQPLAAHQHFQAAALLFPACALQASVSSFCFLLPLTRVVFRESAEHRKLPCLPVLQKPLPTYLHASTEKSMPLSPAALSRSSRASGRGRSACHPPPLLLHLCFNRPFP